MAARKKAPKKKPTAQKKAGARIASEWANALAEGGASLSGGAPPRPWWPGKTTTASSETPMANSAASSTSATSSRKRVSTSTKRW